MSKKLRSCTSGDELAAGAPGDAVDAALMVLLFGEHLLRDRRLLLRRRGRLRGGGPLGDAQCARVAPERDPRAERVERRAAHRLRVLHERHRREALERGRRGAVVARQRARETHLLAAQLLVR